MANIPTPPLGSNRYLVRVEFEGVFYRILYRYNIRDDFWYTDWADDAGVAQVRGVRMVLNTDILAPYKTLSVPPGSVNVVDTTGANLEMTRDEIGGRVKVEYVASG